MRYRLGVVDVAFWPEPEAERDRHAEELGFEHIDVAVDVDPATLVLPVGCPTSYPKPQPGWCATPAPRGGPEMWDAAVRWWTRSPGALLEPHATGVVNTLETVRAMQEAVPGLRLLVDTGHVADMGEDPLEHLEHADHVQLRQGCAGSSQLHVDDARGVVDFAAVLRRLEELDYRGCLSVEYFDIPDHGWPLDDPVTWAADLRAHVASLMH
jgi:sugar phosphate isomerase/epimerase